MSRYSKDDIEALERILKDNDGDSSSDTGESKTTLSIASIEQPLNVARRRVYVKERIDGVGEPTCEKTEPADIAKDLTNSGMEDEQLVESNRQRPKFVFSYSPRGAENLTNCKTLIMDIDLENDDTPVANINLFNTPIEIELQSNIYYLRALLPNKILAESASATFNNNKNYVHNTKMRHIIEHD